MATMANHEVAQPTCQNCSTSTTPLWRRDENGSVLCNACGLFLKLHGRPRPISLKTDVIKSRNRVKTIRPDITVKKKAIPLVIDPNAFDANHAHNNASAAGAAMSGPRRLSAKSANGNGHSEGSHSPISRTGTPSVYPNLPIFHGMEDTAAHFATSQSAPGAAGSASLPTAPFNLAAAASSGASPGRSGSPLNGERGHLDAPQTQEQMATTIGSLKTRVSELEVINELYRSRLSQLEHDMQANRNAVDQLEAVNEKVRKSESDLQAKLDDSHRRENSIKRKLEDTEVKLEDEHRRAEDALRQNEELRKSEASLKRKIDELEDKLKEPKESSSAETQEPARKKLRVSEMVGDSDVSTPPSGV